ncbi:MerR family transcriptional regulator [Streptomyces sp. SID3343]|uniref:MerR family transcriptional regulator n=1 Tax=Streptomyces sp. SID3343 TaxID=2690260 RepID=UPI00136A6A19|nr:MerR family transcriptional regulator [Streptomyces sp. SID3343]MYW01546.1 MerR family transcriptional regulator [Streptomyces sp. SID3343]
MGLVTIGAFARASRLSAKALRLYDELGLLVPAYVDPVTGYRRYAPEQLERARLVAWLRRLGMPLARIRAVCDLDGPAAAHEVRAFWAGVEADTAARRDLAGFLVDYLSTGKDTAMTKTTASMEIRYAARSDSGLVRPINQDTAYAGPRLLAVADGFGSAGGPAGAAAVDVLKRLEPDGIAAGALLDALADAVEQAGHTVREIAAAEPAPGEVGTTLTAMLWTGSALALVHIGDSRAYLLRGGELFRITHDHTVAQSMLDEGRITPDEAISHPQRALLLRALAGTGEVTPDTSLHDAHPGDRYLLCSDGLSTVVPTETIHRTLATTATPAQAVHDLVAQAHHVGAPDNIGCVVADVVARRG